MFGAGCTLGTGFFLGTSLAIHWAGISVLILLVLAAAGTYFVFGALAQMTADDPKEGAERTRAKHSDLGLVLVVDGCTGSLKCSSWAAH
ncbi:hypothetical protein Q0F98_40290 [Paenibacillus amylolyticus]|nr:hypothetical protein Q0F98_40290 [Paenibacillus amylolyticus]